MTKKEITMKKVLRITALRFSQ